MCIADTSEEAEGEEKRNMRISLRKFLLLLLLAVLVIAIVLSLPIVNENRMRIVTSGDIIIDVFSDVQYVPLISLLLQPSYSVGAYTINVSIAPTNQTFTICNVTSGEFTIVWQFNAPMHESYDIAVQLIRDNIVRDTFSFHRSY